MFELKFRADPFVAVLEAQSRMQMLMLQVRLWAHEHNWREEEYAVLRHPMQEIRTQGSRKPERAQYAVRCVIVRAPRKHTGILA